MFRLNHEIEIKIEFVLCFGSMNTISSNQKIQLEIATSVVQEFCLAMYNNKWIN